MKRIALAACALALCAAGQPQPIQVTIDMLRAEFISRSGGSTVYFVGDTHGLNPSARAVLTAQAAWLRMHPGIMVRIEGHADQRSTRDQALALGERRAAAVRDYLILMGVPPAQLSLISWGKERPVVTGAEEAGQALNRRVVTVLLR